MLGAYVMFIFSFTTMTSEESVFAGGLLGIALGLPPVVFFVASFVSNNPTSIRSSLIAWGLWLIPVLVIGLFDLATGLVAGFGAGGVVALRMEKSASRLARVGAVVACAVYTYIVQRIAPEFGLFAGAPLPFLAIAAVDSYVERFGPPAPADVSP
jgi:uncharacterized integral membrane protein